MSTPSSSTDTVTVSVSTLSTVLAAAIHQATGTAPLPLGWSRAADSGDDSGTLPDIDAVILT